MATAHFRLFDVILTIQGGPVVAVHAIDHIQAAIAAAITGTATLGIAVDQDRPEERPWPIDQLASANVYVETDELVSRSTDGEEQPLEIRRAKVQIIIKTKKAAGAGNLLRTAMAEVVVATASNVDLGLGVLDSFNDSTLIELEADHSEKEVATATMDWIVDYQIRANAPSTILSS